MSHPTQINCPESHLLTDLIICFWIKVAIIYFMGNEQPVEKEAQIGVDRYTEIRRKTLHGLLDKLLEYNAIRQISKMRVIDLGSFQGSSSQALREIGALEVISVDQNPQAIKKGMDSGFIKVGVVSDMVQYLRNMSFDFSGIITAFNCILYLSPNDVWELFYQLEAKLSSGSQFIFSISRTQEDWKAAFEEYLQSRGGTLSYKLYEGLVQGDLDYYCFIVTFGSAN